MKLKQQKALALNTCMRNINLKDDIWRKKMKKKKRRRRRMEEEECNFG